MVVQLAVGCCDAVDDKVIQKSFNLYENDETANRTPAKSNTRPSDELRSRGSSATMVRDPCSSRH
jgi:hypothetical protein